MRRRIFIAVKFPEAVTKEIKRIQGLFGKKNLFIGKFTDLENIHLTLKFLGEIEERDIKEVEKRLEGIKFGEVKCEIENIGVFGEHYIKILWLHLKGVEELQKKIDERLKCFFEPERRFMSHITIARIKKVLDRSSLLNFVDIFKVKKIKFCVGEFFLMESKLEKTGPSYLIIKEYKLK